MVNSCACFWQGSSRQRLVWKAPGESWESCLCVMYSPNTSRRYSSTALKWIWGSHRSDTLPKISFVEHKSLQMNYIYLCFYLMYLINNSFICLHMIYFSGKKRTHRGMVCKHCVNCMAFKEWQKYIYGLRFKFCCEKCRSLVHSRVFKHAPLLLM